MMQNIKADKKIVKRPRLDISLENEMQGDFDINQDEKDWLMSYSDMVTLLLTFFILFFNVNTNQGNQNKASDENALAQKKYEEGFKIGLSQAKREMASISSPMPSTQEGPLDEKMQTVKTVLDEIKDLKDVQTMKAKDYFIVLFNEGNLFDKGSYRISKTGEKMIREVTDILKPFKEKIYIEVQGHSDNTPVKLTKNKKYKSNIELSVLRAQSVYDIIKMNGMAEEGLSISGHGEHRTLAKNKDFTEQQLANVKNRRVSLRIEPR